jgi:hypothetical protein
MIEIGCENENKSARKGRKRRLQKQRQLGE